MKRTDATGHDTNRYTEGNPSLGVPATVVGAEEMNNIQEEICNVIEDQGITLDGAVENQLLLALRSMIQAGGVQYTQTIADNTTANVTNLLFDKLTYKAARVFFDIHRRDDTQSANETGELYISHDTENDVWTINLMSHGDDAGVSFAISAAGQVSYTSSSFGGASYSGTMKFTHITTIAQ